jgi:hypothetical protein
MMVVKEKQVPFIGRKSRNKSLLQAIIDGDEEGSLFHFYKKPKHLWYLPIEDSECF